MTTHPFRLSSLLMMGAFFLILGYECARSASSSLLLEKYSPDILPTVLLFIPLLLFTVLIPYNYSLSYWGPRFTFLASIILSMIVLSMLAYLIQQGFNGARLVLYLVTEVYIMLLVEQCWALVNSAFDISFAEKFNGPFTGVGTIGGILGGLLVGHLATRLGTISLVFFTAVFLFPLLWIGWSVYSLSSIVPVNVKQEKTPFTVGWKTLRENPLLKNLFIIVLATQVISTLWTIGFQTLLKAEIPNVDLRTAYSGRFYALLNSICLGLQFLVTPLLLKKWGPIPIQMGLPFLNLVAAVAVLITPSLPVMAAALLTFKVLDYSLFRATKEVLYIPLSFEARYRSKGIVDIFGYRASKALTSSILTVLKTAFTLSATLYGALSLVAGVIWITRVAKLRGSLKERL